MPDISNLAELRQVPLPELWLHYEMPRIHRAAALVFFWFSLAHLGAADLKLHVLKELRGPDSSAQLVVMGSRDLTREAQVTFQPEGIIEMTASGLMTPLSSGKATLVVRHGELEARETVTVRDFENEKLYSFPNDILPVITRNHCNSGACHAKTDAQNAFTLSLFGYDPLADYEVLVKHSRGRRISPPSPELSLVLLKASGGLPHEGGARLDSSSSDYQAILKWITQGARYQLENDPSVGRISVFPSDLVAHSGDLQQIAVWAHFSDGSIRDITQVCQFESNQPDMVKTTETGLVNFSGKAGSASIMVRFREHVDVVRATIPLSKDQPAQPQPHNHIDEEIFRQLSLLGIPASDLATDPQFLRRVTLDIAGRLPTLEETRAFLSSTDPEKRSKRINELLESTDYADYFAGKWAGILRNKADPGLDWVYRETFSLHSWIRTSFLENKPFHHFARELVTASGSCSDNPAVGWYRNITDSKERMEDIAQVFLGIRMKCAQCHHHPYEPWSQNDYYHFAAFFTTIDRKAVHKLPEDDIIFHNRKPAEILNSASKEKVRPAVPGGKPLSDLPPESDPRFALADWMGDPENPFFARVLVNRYWKHFFGRGLVEPEDDIRPTNPATHPDLLDRLASDFIRDGYSLKKLIATLCNSRAYQLSSEPKGGNFADEQNFARFYPRRLQAEVLLDAFNDLTGSKNSFNRQPNGARAISLPDSSSNNESPFLAIFGRPQMDTACECERSPEANLGQSLTLINSDLIQQKLSNGGRARSLANEKDIPLETSLKDLYLLAFCREPLASEIEQARAHLQKKIELAAHDEKISESIARGTAFEDLIWVLANTKEFMFNH